MNTLQDTLAEYAAGLEAELTLLHHLHRLADEQHHASARPDLETLTRICHERERVVAGLLLIEDRIGPLRETIAARKAEAARVPGFAEVSARHRVAADLVAAILHADQVTMEALRAADTARRLTSQTLEHGGTTLAAYRRVVAPRTPGAALVDRRG